MHQGLVDLRQTWEHLARELAAGVPELPGVIEQELAGLTFPDLTEETLIKVSESVVARVADAGFPDQATVLFRRMGRAMYELLLLLATQEEIRDRGASVALPVGPALAPVSRVVPPPPVRPEVEPAAPAPRTADASPPPLAGGTPDQAPLARAEIDFGARDPFRPARVREELRAVAASDSVGGRPPAPESAQAASPTAERASQTAKADPAEAAGLQQGSAQPSLAAPPAPPGATPASSARAPRPAPAQARPPAPSQPVPAASVTPPPVSREGPAAPPVALPSRPEAAPAPVPKRPEPPPENLAPPPPQRAAPSAPSPAPVAPSPPAPAPREVSGDEAALWGFDPATRESDRAPVPAEQPGRDPSPLVPAGAGAVASGAGVSARLAPPESVPRSGWTVRLSPRSSTERDRKLAARHEHLPQLLEEIVATAKSQQAGLSNRGNARRAQESARDKLPLAEGADPTVQISALLEAGKLEEAAAVAVHMAATVGGEEAAHIACTVGEGVKQSKNFELAVLCFTTAVVAAPPCDRACWQLCNLSVERRDVTMAPVWLEYIARLLRARGADLDSISVYRQLLKLTPKRSDIREMLRTSSLTGTLPD